MIITKTLAEWIRAEQGLFFLLSKDDAPQEQAFRLGLLHEKLIAPITRFERQRQILVRKYTPADGGKATPEKEASFIDELQTLQDVTLDVEFEPIKVGTLAAVKIPGIVFSQCCGLIVE